MRIYPLCHPPSQSFPGSSLQVVCWVAKWSKARSWPTMQPQQDHIPKFIREVIKVWNFWTLMTCSDTVRKTMEIWWNSCPEVSGRVPMVSPPFRTKFSRSLPTKKLVPHLARTCACGNPCGAHGSSSCPARQWRLAVQQLPQLQQLQNRNIRYAKLPRTSPQKLRTTVWPALMLARPSWREGEHDGCTAHPASLGSPGKGNGTSWLLIKNPSKRTTGTWGNKCKRKHQPIRHEVVAACYKYIVQITVCTV